jgi:hypothetical protein
MDIIEGRSSFYAAGEQGPCRDRFSVIRINILTAGSLFAETHCLAASALDREEVIRDVDIGVGKMILGTYFG